MQEKSEKILSKITKKDYNNQLEAVLEKKYFDENVKSILLSILYKIETSYKDYKQVKQDVETKEEFILRVINTIQNNCDEIKVVKPNSEESKIIGNKTFLVEKSKKRIICHNIERKLLYCIAKIGKKEKIVNDNYFIINETISNLINTGNNIATVEPLRDFNGYSWTSIPREIESIEHNLIYQNLVLLVGNQFLDNWIFNSDIMRDYWQVFYNKMEELYGEENEENLKDIEDNIKFIEKITLEKRKLAKQIRKVDETLNSKTLLQEEYVTRNEILPLEEKIFSIRILKKLMIKEREEKIERLEKLKLELQKLFLKCFEARIEKVRY